MKSAKSGERGQTLPIVAICLLLLFGFAALAVDAGYLEYKQRTQQTAADAAAVAGAYALFNGANVNTAAQASASTNGFTNDGTTVIISATSPPATGFNTSNKNAVEATVTVKYPAIFSAIWRSKNTVSTRAVAAVQSNPNGPCIWALDKDITNNNGTITAPCGMIAGRNIHLGTANVPSIAAGGNIDGTSPPSGTVETTGISTPLTDPCTSGVIPGCKALVAMYPFGSTPGPGAGTPYQTCSLLPPVGPAVTAGCYPSMSGTLNLAPGLYVIKGDLSNATLTCSLCSATLGVTLVVGGKVNLNGSSSVLNSLPNYQGVGTPAITAAGAPGVLFYQTSTNTNPENFSSQSLLGMIYAPGAHVNINAGTTLTTTFVVASDIVSNNAIITIPGGSGGGNPMQVPVLAE